MTASESPIEINTNLINEITINCEAESNPLATVIWIAGGTTVLNGRCQGIDWQEFFGAEASLDYDSILTEIPAASGLGIDQFGSVPRNCLIDIAQNGSATPFPLTQSPLTIHDLLHEDSKTLLCVGNNEFLGMTTVTTVTLILDGKILHLFVVF